MNLTDNYCHSVKSKANLDLQCSNKCKTNEILCGKHLNSKKIILFKKMKICLVCQHAGVGDVFFLQYVARKYLNVLSYLYKVLQLLIYDYSYLNVTNFIYKTKLN